MITSSKTSRPGPGMGHYFPAWGARPARNPGRPSVIHAYAARIIGVLTPGRTYQRGPGAALCNPYRAPLPGHRAPGAAVSCPVCALRIRRYQFLESRSVNPTMGGARA